MHHLITFLYLNLFGPSLVCGDGAGVGGSLYLEASGIECADGFEQVCAAGSFEKNWTLGVCCEPDDSCRYTLVPGCEAGEKLTCGIVPVLPPDPWICNPIGTLDAYVNTDTAACELGELHVCTHGDAPPDPDVIVCCDDEGDACRLAPGDESCNVDEWLACSHAR